ncbi:MAG: hypothetical protein IKE31_10650 [Eubacterium sp.]|nr:hypothetical protein [Eubacterium sp.]
MSQQKVDYHKEQKRNRAKIMKKEKAVKRLEITIAVVVLAALVGWFGYMVAQNRKTAAPTNVNTTVLSLGAVDSYMSELQSMLSGEEEAETGEAEETAEAEDTEESAETAETEETAESTDTAETE